MYKNNPLLKLNRKFELFKKAGEISMLKSNFLPYNSAKRIVHSFGIKSKNEWIKFCRNKQVNIPASPSKTYKNLGWVSWKDWLGYSIQIIKHKDPVPIFMIGEEGVLEYFSSIKSAGRWLIENKITNSSRPSSLISQCCHGKRPSVYGYKWMLSETILM